MAINLTLSTPERIIISKAKVGELKRWMME